MLFNRLGLVFALGLLTMVQPLDALAGIGDVQMAAAKTPMIPATDTFATRRFRVGDPPSARLKLLPVRDIRPTTTRLFPPRGCRVVTCPVSGKPYACRQPTICTEADAGRRRV